MPTSELHDASGTFLAADGTELGYVVHRPPNGSVKDTAFLYLHGIESHAGWFAEAARLLSADGYPVYSIERRGSGINRENRGCPSGHVPRGVDLLEDLHRAVRNARLHSGARGLYLIGLSWGGKYAMAYDVRHPGEVDGLILITPGIKPKVDVGICEKLAILRDAIFAPERPHKIPIQPEMFTTTPRLLDFIKNDPLRLRTVSAAFLWQSRGMDRLLDRRGSTPHAPVLIFLAGNDRIIDNDATRRFLARYRDHDLRIIDYPDQTHSIQLDAPERLVRDIIAWVESKTC